MKYSNYSVVIIGSGLAGLYLACKLSDANLSDGILVVTKSKLFSGSTSLAQGGIVSVIPELNPEDSVESHIKDTIRAGCGLNDISTVRHVSEYSSLAIQELLRFGVEFDRNEKNALNFTLEGAHSHRRILHAQGDSTGKIIEETLCNYLKNKNNVDIYEYTSAVELLVDLDKNCRGVVTYNSQNNNFEAIYSNNVILATGGIGQLYKYTTNPKESTADGIALAKNSGCELSNMEFIQFHPTGLYCKNCDIMPLVSEAVRGEGAKLVNVDGDYFAKNYHHLAELAPRDIVARAIKEEISKTNSSYVNLDISSIGLDKFKKRFPTITNLCEENGVDLSTLLIPVAPVQHYFMGGIKVDINSKTTINNLFAIGECASTGLHGANRLASNSLLECAVFAHNLAEYIVNNVQTPPKKLDSKIINTIESYSLESDTDNSDITLINVLFERLKETMSENCSIVRTEKSLKKALNELNEIENIYKQYNVINSKEKFEFQNALSVAKSIVESALIRKNSIGAHYRADYPHMAVNDTNLVNTITKGIIENGKLLA